MWTVLSQILRSSEEKSSGEDRKAELGRASNVLLWSDNLGHPPQHVRQQLQLLQKSEKYDISSCHECYCLFSHRNELECCVTPICCQCLITLWTLCVISISVNRMQPLSGEKVQKKTLCHCSVAQLLVLPRTVLSGHWCVCVCLVAIAASCAVPCCVVNSVCLCVCVWFRVCQGATESVGIVWCELNEATATHTHLMRLNRVSLMRFNGWLHFLTWLSLSQFAERKFSLSTYLSQKVKWFRWANVLRANVWSKYILRPTFSWTLV